MSACPPCDNAAVYLHLLERGKDEHGRLTHTRLSLAKDVGTQDGLGNALLLD